MDGRLSFLSYPAKLQPGVELSSMHESDDLTRPATLPKPPQKMAQLAEIENARS